VRRGDRRGVGDQRNEISRVLHPEATPSEEIRLEAYKAFTQGRLRSIIRVTLAWLWLQAWRRAQLLAQGGDLLLRLSHTLALRFLISVLARPSSVSGSSGFGLRLAAISRQACLCSRVPMRWRRAATIWP
jgi:hypothetical protein